MRVWLSIALILGSASNARGDSNVSELQRDEARRRFEQGKLYYEQASYSEAVRAYLAAYKLTRFPELVFNIGQAYRMAGNEGEALRAYELFLEQEPRGELSDEARTHVLELRSRGVVANREALRADSGIDQWAGFNARQDERADADDLALQHRRGRTVFGADITKVSVEDGGMFGESEDAFAFSIHGGYYWRFHRHVVFEPRALLGMQTPLGEHGMSVQLELQARLLLFPTPWCFFGVTAGGGVSSLADAVNDQGGAIGSAFLELGLLVKDQYEISIGVHPMSLVLFANDENGPGNRVLAPVGLSVGYHL